MSTKIIKTVRLNEDECLKIGEWLEQNNPNLSEGQPPLEISEVVHLLIAIALKNMRIAKNGKVEFCAITPNMGEG